MRTLICIAALLAFMTSASAAFHGGGGHGEGGFHGGGGFHGAMHGGDFHGGGFRGGRGFHGGGPGFWYGGAWCTWPQYYAGLCTFD
jgi:hypothetical protein